MNNISFGILKGLTKSAAFRPIRDIYTKGLLGRLARNPEALTGTEMELVHQLSGGNPNVTDRVIESLSNKDLPGYLGSRMLTSTGLPSLGGAIGGFNLANKGIGMIPIGTSNLSYAAPIGVGAVLGGLTGELGRYGSARSLMKNLNLASELGSVKNLTNREREFIDLVQNTARAEKIKHYAPYAAGATAAAGLGAGSLGLASALSNKKNNA